jgi:NADH:ubiquinone oxidoreductase subunit 4 (subunit M)
MIALLFVSLGIPAVTALLLMLFRTSLNQSSARWIACCGSVATLLFSVLLLVQYRTVAVYALESGEFPAFSVADKTSAIHPKVEFRRPWLSSGQNMQLEMYFGLDGISISMIALTS